MIHILLCKKPGKTNFEMNVLSNGLEKYMSFDSNNNFY